MHELSIALSILDSLDEEARRRAPARITAVHIKLGPLSGVIKEALASAFEMAREETAHSHCRLIINEVPIIVFCPQCQAERSPESIQQLCCSHCRAPTPEIRAGKELEVTALEITQ